MVYQIIQYGAFYSILCAYLFLKRKINNEKHNNILSWIFVGIFIVYQFLLLRVFAVDMKSYIYSNNAVLFFVLAFIFDFKKCLVAYFFVILMQLSIDIKDYIIYYRVIDYTYALIVIISGDILKKKIYKDRWPNPLDSFIFIFLIGPLYIIISFIISLIIKNNDSVKFVSAIEDTYKFIIGGFLTSFISFVIIYVFSEKKKKQYKSILHSFIEKYNRGLIVAVIIVLIFATKFNTLYLKSRYVDILEVNFSVANDMLKKSYNKYGNDFFVKDTTIISDFDTWIISNGGAFFVFDKNKNMVNEFDLSKYEKDYYDVDIGIFDEKNFVDIYKYEEDKVIEYQNSNYKYLIKYKKLGNFYLLAFIPYDVLLEDSIVSTQLSFLIATINTMCMLLFVYIIFKKLVEERFIMVNKNLQKIISGDYDIKFNDNSSKEFLELSDSINKTVDTLKNSITEIAEKNKEEMNLAKKIQLAQWPDINDITIGYSFYGSSIPASEVGGDFFDRFMIDDKNVMCIIADVSGKGIAAALFMMKAKYTIRNFAKQYVDINTIFDKTNKELCVNNDTLMFVTCFAFILNITTGKIQYLNAGHNNPVIIKNDNEKNDSSYLDATPSHMLGIDEKSLYKSYEINLNVGDKILLYTDGVTEAKNNESQFYGEDRLLNKLNKIDNKNSKDLCDYIIEDVHSFSNGADQSDDITILCLEYNGRNNKIEFKANLSESEKGNKLLKRFASIYDINVDIYSQLCIVYDEIVSNIVKFAYKDGNGDIIFHLNLLNDDTIEMVFVDKGKEFDPIKYNEKDVEHSVDEKQNGGMGIMFCRNIMDDITYKREDDSNILMLYKKNKIGEN